VLSLAHDWYLSHSCYESFLFRAASQEVGQVILTLPFIFSLLGMASGIILQLFFATLALYTNYLLMALHTEYRHIINTDPKHPKHGDPHHIVSYYGNMILINNSTTFTFLLSNCVFYLIQKLLRIWWVPALGYFLKLLSMLPWLDYQLFRLSQLHRTVTFLTTIGTSENGVCCGAVYSCLWF
jgi:hypothetical protein